MRCVALIAECYSAASSLRLIALPLRQATTKHERRPNTWPDSVPCSTVSLDMRAVLPGELVVQLTLRGVCSFIMLIASNSSKYGFNISALNSLSSAISCIGIQSTSSWLPRCFPMGATRFGYLTSIYTIGGLVGSLCTGTIADKRGRRSACIAGASSIAIGGAIMALAPAFGLLLFGRCAKGN